MYNYVLLTTIVDDQQKMYLLHTKFTGGRFAIIIISRPVFRNIWSFLPFYMHTHKRVENMFNVYVEKRAGKRSPCPITVVFYDQLL